MLAVSWTESALYDVDIIAEYFLAKGTPVELVENLVSYLLSLSRRFGVLLGKGTLGKVPGTDAIIVTVLAAVGMAEVTGNSSITILPDR